MFDAETTALLRAVLDEVCENVSKYEAGTRTHSKILEAATLGETSMEDLRRIGAKSARQRAQHVGGDAEGAA
jgi:hypothetical protein